MKQYAFYQEENLIADKLKMAETFIPRFLGLMPKKTLEDGEGLILKNCSSIHCFFMKFAIDVVYLDKNYCIVGKQNVKPWRIGKSFKGARHVIELKSGAAQMLEIGKRTEIKEVR